MMSSALLPLLGHLGNQLALQSSSLSQSATSLKNQVCLVCPVCIFITWIIPSLLYSLHLSMQLHSHEEFVSQFVCEQTQKIENLNATVQRENCKEVRVHV